ncbi:MAG: LTA synthase family protein [Planctomycetes bacterium]|nr:LTA synthase family protein [Planctomycetota bacterium]
MLARLRFLVLYLVFWLAYFVAARGLFLGYHHARAAELDGGTLLGTFVHGFRLDLATATFATALPVFAVALSTVFPPRRVAWVVGLYTLLLLGLLSFMLAGDMELYRTWGARLDGTVLTYLRTPSKAYASSAASPLGLLSVLGLLLFSLSAFVYLRWMWRSVARFPEAKPITGLPVFLASLPLVIAARGGLQLSPLNLSSAYFSREPFANHAAINAIWNFMDSVYAAKHGDEARYALTGDDEARATVAQLLPPLSPPRKLLRLDRPNVILVIWEACTAKVMARTGGRSGVLPHLERLSHEGVLFDRLYASGGRSDKGLVALQSGFPAQPRSSVMRVPTKTARLPILSRSFAAAGYSTGYFYGGELEFANMRSYVVHGQFDTVLAKQDFDPKFWNSKWGAHDEVVLDALLEGCKRARTPFFNVTFTLSSHEPYEIPGPPTFPGDGEVDKFLNAMAYTDRCVADFVERAKQEPWWNDTLIVIVADHGHRLPQVPGHIGRSAPEDYHVPMVWLGGALAVQGEVISTIGSHADLPNTLLSQLGLSTQAYGFGKDLLAPDVVPFAHYSFTDGFGFVTPAGIAVWDNVGAEQIDRRGNPGERELTCGKAFQQQVERAFIDL